MQFVSTGDYVVRAAWRPAGGEFEAPVSISASATQTPAVRVAMNSGGDAVAVWTQWTGSGGITQEAIRSARSVAWQPAHTLTESGETVAPVPPDVAIDQAGDALAVWENSVGGAAGLGRRLVCTPVRPFWPERELALRTRRRPNR